MVLTCRKSLSDISCPIKGAIWKQVTKPHRKHHSILSFSLDTLDNRATASVLRSSLSASVRPRITGQTLQGSIIWGVGYIPTSMLQLLCCTIYSLATLFTCSSTSLVSAKPCSKRTNSAAWLVFRTLFKIMLQRRQLRITRNKYNLIIGVREKPDNQGQ